MRRALVALNASLALIFALAFGVLTFAPASVERQAHREVVQRLAASAAERYSELLSPGWTDSLRAVLRGEAAAFRAEIASSRLDAVAALFSWFCRYCGPPERIADRLRAGLSERLRGLDAALERVEDWARERYLHLIDELITDLKIFTGTNAVLSILAALAARTQARSRVTLVASGIFFLTLAVSAWLYLFKQDWLLTIVIADYFGYGYVVWVLLLAAILFDVAFNRGRVVAILVQAIAAPLGS